MERKIKFGWAEVDITPKEKIRLNGQFFERISDEVETPLSVTALAIDSGEEQAVICSCDLVVITEGLIADVRAKLKETTEGLDVSKVIIGATHTHTSYVYSSRGVRSGPSSLDIIKRYLPEGKKYIPLASGEAMDGRKAAAFLIDRIAEAIKQAWENRDYGYYANEFGRAAVGMCRRIVYDDGSAQMWGDSNTANFSELEGGNDSGIEMLFCFDKNKKFTGVLVNVACPSQVVEQRSFISSDFWGKLKIYMREKFGEDIFILGLASPAGDQCPRDLVRWVEPETPIDDPNVSKRTLSRKADPSMYDVAGTWKIGKRIFYEVADAYEEAVKEMTDTAEFIHKAETLELPLRRATRAEYEEAQNKIIEFFRYCDNDIDYNVNAGLYVYAGTIKRYEEQQTMDVVPIELHTMRLGDVAFANSPFELFLDYGNRIRARSYAKQTFLFQLTAGSMGYLPTERAERGSHYSAYISSGTVGHVGGDMLVRTTLDRINKMF